MTKPAHSDNLLVYLLIGTAVIFVLLSLTTGYPVQIVLPLLKALLLSAGVFVYGFFLRSVMNIRRQPIDFASAFAVGMVFTTFFFYLASIFKLLVPAIFIIYYSIPVILLIWIFRKKTPVYGTNGPDIRPAKDSADELSALSKVQKDMEIGDYKTQLLDGITVFFNRSPLEYLIFSLPFIYALLPPSFYDTLVYHLGIPNLYLHHSGFIETPQFLFANTSIYYEISLIPAVYAGELVPRLFHFIVGAIFLFSAADFAQDFLGLKKRSTFLLLLVSMPMSIFLLSTVKNDIVGAFFVFLGMKYVIKKNIPLAGLFWGFSIGIKYVNGFFLVIFLTVFYINEWISSRKNSLNENQSGSHPVNLKVIIRHLFLLTAIIIIVVLPLLVKNFIYAKNPFFPFFYKYFNSPYWDASRFESMQADVGRMFHSIKDILRFPYTVSFKELGFGGIAGVQFLAFLPFLLIPKIRLKKPYYLLLFAIIALFLGGYFTGSLRFLYIVFIIFTLYLGVIVDALPGITIPLQRIIKGLIFLVVILNFLTAFGSQERFYHSYELLSGKLDIETYKASLFPTYPGIAYVNRHSGLNSRVLFVGEARNYYLNRAYMVSSGIDYSIVKKYLEASVNTEGFISALKQDQINYIILNLGEFNRQQKEYHVLKDREWRKMELFLGGLNSRKVFQKGGIAVYKLDE